MGRPVSLLELRGVEAGYGASQVLFGIDLTVREGEVATLLARGLGTTEIAEALVVSPHTVQDHVKSLFEKLGVASRQELVARVFLEEYLPEVLVGTPLASTGRFEATYPSASASTAA